MRRLRLLAAVLLAAVALGWPGHGARAADGTEVVVVLDTSRSMIGSYRGLPPADPDRRAILGTLLLEALTRDTEDRFTLISMHSRPVPGGAPDAIREIPFLHFTPYRPALEAAREQLTRSPRVDRLLVFLSDGAPTDLNAPEEGRALLAPDGQAPLFDVVSLGLLPAAYPDTAVEGAARFLRPLAGPEGSYRRVDDAADLVDEFTRAWAGVLGSKALTGTLAPDESRSFRIGRYVTEVMVVVAGREPTGPLTARLTTDDGPAAPKVEGDNGCARCRRPFTHWAAWRLPHDPETEGRATLTLERARGPATFGVILRYDLDARVEAPARGPSGGTAPLRAWLSWRGERFDDARFFEEDGFEARVEVGERSLALLPSPDGTFQLDLPLPAEPAGTEVPFEVVFRNDWMEERTRGRLTLTEPLELDLALDPPALDLGAWSAETGPTERCGTVRIVGEHPADLSLTPTFQGVPEEVVLAATPLDATGAPTEDATADAWRICLTAPGCCGEVGVDATIRLAGTHPRATPVDLGLPVRAQVAAAGFWPCWGPWIGALLALILLALVVLGFLRGHDFDPDATVRIAGSERKLQRASALVLREQPRGRRGFYRNARACLTASGEWVASPRRAAVHLEATGHGARFHLRGPLERRDRRTRTWTRLTEDEALDGPTPGVVYRVGDLYLRFD